jgi:hypothetical protein
MSQPTLDNLKAILDDSRGNLQPDLARIEWLIMRWNALVSLSLPGAGQSLTSDENSKQLLLPGFAPDEKSPAL